MMDFEPEEGLLVTDAVCGLRFPLGKAVSQEDYEGWAYFFCSDACRRLFLSAPERYASSRPSITPERTGQIS